MGDYEMLAYVKAMRFENKKMMELLKEIQDISCGEEQVAEDDGEGMKFIFDLITQKFPNL